jgi:putative endonuclease
MLLLITFNINSLNLFLKSLGHYFMQKIHMYYVYMLTTGNNKVIYTGVTNDLIRRCYEHKTGLNEGFTKKYNVHKLIYFDFFNFIELTISREKQIK